MIWTWGVKLWNLGKSRGAKLWNLGRPVPPPEGSSVEEVMAYLNAMARWSTHRAIIYRIFWSVWYMAMGWLLRGFMDRL